MNSLGPNRHYVILALLLSAFVYVAAQRLGTVPLPETDEAYTLQVSYEMLFHGKLALPMLRYLGGNIESVWHSYTPLYFLLLGGFFKLVGWGLLQGRVFNLATAVLVLLMTYVIGRRAFDWRAGLIAVVMLVSDVTFLERSRVLRNDYAAAFFAMLGFYLYETAEKQRQARYYVASGLAAGAGVMCHTNIIYMVGAISLLMLMRRGWRLFAAKEFYLFLGGTFGVTAYEIVYDIADYRNFILQNRDDKLHFMLFRSGGLWNNFTGEVARYRAWYVATSEHAGIHYGLIFHNLPVTLLHLFQVLTVVAIAYLIFGCITRIRQRNMMSDTRVSILTITTFSVIFHAGITGHKEIYYMVHLVPWFALSVGITLRDLLDRIKRPRPAQRPQARMIYSATALAVILGILAYSVLLVKQYERYYRGLRNPNLVTFDEYESVLRDVVPQGLCPVVNRISPSIWLAFPEMDACFADIEKRMRSSVDIDGKDYALFTPNERAEYHLLGEMKDTAYGPQIYVYYTGADPRYAGIAPKVYQFFGWERGHIPQQ